MIELNNLSKSYKSNEVFRNVSHTFDDGTITVIEGRNGSGKTVLLKLICGLSKATDGNVSVYPENALFGVIIETIQFWNERTGFDTLKYLASIRKTIDDSVIEDYLKLFGMYEKRNARVRTYSLGMRQKLAVIQAFMENPDIILLDEPTNGLDDDAIEVFRNLLVQEKKKGKTIIITTHNPEDFLDLADESLCIRHQSLAVKNEVNTNE